MKKNMIVSVCWLILISLANGQTRIKDIVEIVGLRENQLLGMGLVAGLKNTGDKSEASLKALQNLLKKHKFQVTPDLLTPGNIALVMVTATLPPLARKGSKLDITVASIGDAKSLSGGILLTTFLKALDQNTYAVAQGVLSQSSNLPTNVLATNGAIVEREIPVSLTDNGELFLRLLASDFNTAAKIAEAVNQKFGQTTPCSYAVDMSLVKIIVPKPYLMQDKIAQFIADIFDLAVTPDTPARVVVQERTGTVIMGDAVTISPVSIVHNQIMIHIGVDDPKAGTVTVQRLVSALNGLQVSARDLVDILRLLKRAGALHAELVIM